MNNAITQVLQHLHSAVNTGDEEALSACYGNHAKVIASPINSATERDCITALNQFQQKFMPDHIVTTGDEIVIEAGDVALVVAKLYLVPKQTPNALPCESKRAVYVMQRQSEGKWKCIIDNFFGTDLLDFA